MGSYHFFFWNVASVGQKQTLLTWHLSPWKGFMLWVFVSIWKGFPGRHGRTGRFNWSACSRRQLSLSWPLITAPPSLPPPLRSTTRFPQNMRSAGMQQKAVRTKAMFASDMIKFYSRRQAILKILLKRRQNISEKPSLQGILLELQWAAFHLGGTGHCFSSEGPHVLPSHGMISFTTNTFLLTG